MPTIIEDTIIAAPPETCFDAARDISLHCQTAAQTGERAVAGVTSGLIELGESVTFEGVHFGIRQRFTAQVTHFERPKYFVDEMTRGAFASMRHRHEFSARGQSTLMRDTIEWRSPCGILGIIADKFFLERHLRSFLIQRNTLLKHAIETDTEIAKARLKVL